MRSKKEAIKNDVDAADPAVEFPEEPPSRNRMQ